MFHTKFQGNQPCGSGGGVVFLKYMGISAILVMRHGLNIYTFFLPLPGGCITKLNEIESPLKMTDN